MRKSPIRDILQARGAVFAERAGVEVPLNFGDAQAEYTAVREAVGITDFSFVTRHMVPEEGLDLLEKYAAGSVASIRFGRVLHTMAVDNDGMLESDLYIANDDENLFVLGESLVDDDRTSSILEELGASEAGAVDLADTWAVFGIDGFNAWAVAKELFGADVLGLPYLSIENYELGDIEVKLIRGGKTSEFGYLILVPADHASTVWERIEKAGEPHGMKAIGVEAHSMLRLDGRFFNIHEEGRVVRDPLPLGLQWMIDIDGEDFRGMEAIMARREAGLSKKIIGIATTSKDAGLEVGDKILHGQDQVAKVVSAIYSPTLGVRMGLAVFDLPFAFASLSFTAQKGQEITTISMPPFTPKSLSVKLDEM